MNTPTPAEPDRPPHRLRVAAQPEAPKPPSHLRPATKRWWSETVRDYDLEAHHLKLLQAAAEAWDRLGEARVLLRREGIVVEGRFGAKAHPAVAIERDARTAFARLIRELDLDGEPAPDPRVRRRS